jgi:hypothetical protein
MSTTAEQYFDQLLQKDLEPRNPPPKAKLSFFYRKHKELIEHLASGTKTRVVCCGAKLINLFTRWTNWKRPIYKTGWVYHTLADLREELLEEHSIHVIREAIALLERLGFLHKRKNFRADNWRNGQDRTHQYLLRIDRIITALNQLFDDDADETLETNPFVEPESPSVPPDSPADIDERHTQIPSADSCTTSLFEAKEKDLESENGVKHQQPPLSMKLNQILITRLARLLSVWLRPRFRRSMKEREQYEWEISVGKPYPDFIRWRANTHYKPQGGHWAADAEGHAVAEIIKKTQTAPELVSWMWQSFLKFAEKAADGALAVHTADAGQPSLPACFKDDTRDTDEVSAKLKQAKEVVEAAEESKLAKEADKAAALPPAELTEEEKAAAQLQERLAAFKAQWASFKDKPQLQRLLNALILKVESTPGLVMTDNGPSVISQPYKSDQESCC